MMSPAEATARRLVAALEEFTEQQAFLISVGNASHAHELQRRAAPLIARLCELGAQEPGLVRALGARWDSLMEARRKLQIRLSSRRDRLESERHRLAEARRRVFGVAPAYAAQIDGKRARFSATV